MLILLGFVLVTRRGLNYSGHSGPVNWSFLTRYPAQPNEARGPRSTAEATQAPRHPRPYAYKPSPSIPSNPTAQVLPLAAAVASSSSSSVASPPPTPWGDVRSLDPFHLPSLSPLLALVTLLRFDPCDEWMRLCGRVLSPCLGFA